MTAKNSAKLALSAAGFPAYPALPNPVPSDTEGQLKAQLLRWQDQSRRHVANGGVVSTVGAGRSPCSTQEAALGWLCAVVKNLVAGRARDGYSPIASGTPPNRWIDSFWRTV